MKAHPRVHDPKGLVFAAHLPATLEVPSNDRSGRPACRVTRARLVSWALTILLASACVVPARAASVPTPGPTVAREDTMFTQVPEVLVRAPRVTLDEILARVARGEASRDSALHDEAFTATFRLVKGAGTPGAEVLSERVIRVYKKKPHLVRTVPIRAYDKDPQKNADMQVSFRPDMDEEIVNFAFRAETRRNYRYRIVDRTFVGGHLIYQIAFEPRSALDPSSPAGTVWVDTNEFVIVRQQITYLRSPAPLFIKNVSRMVIERRKFGDHWALSRLLMRIQSTLPIPKLGRDFDVALMLDDYAINAGIEDSFFRAAKP